MALTTAKGKHVAEVALVLAPRRPSLPTCRYISPHRQRQPSSHHLYFMADSLRPRMQSFAGSVLSHRVFLYSFASTLAVSATVINALQNQSNFYSVAVYLSKSGASVLVIPFYTLSTFQQSHLLILFRFSLTLAYSWL